MNKTLWLTLCAALALGACGDDDGATDAGMGADTTPGGDTGPGGDAGPGDDAGPGTDAGPGMDAGPGTDAGDDTGPSVDCPDLVPTQGDSDLIISQYNVTTGEIEFFNPTAAPIDLDGYVLCSRPAYQTIADSGVSVPAMGYATFTPSAAFVGADAASGELALYDSVSYASRAAMIDFVCWGTTPIQSRKSVAEMTLGEEVLWEGECSAAPTMEVVARSVGVAGTTAGDYDNTAAFATHTCE